MPIARHLELEGHTVRIVARPELASEQDDLLLTDQTVSPDTRKVPTIGASERFDSHLLRAYSLDPSPTSGDHLLVKWYDRSNGFHHQLLVGFPVTRLMVGDLGPRTQAGAGARYLDQERCPKGLFEDNVALQATLETMGYSGPVCVERDSRSGKVASIEIGLGAIVLFNLLEGLPCPIVDWLDDPLSKTLYQSWTVNVLVSRYPYPSLLENGKVALKGLTRSAEKHFWTFGGSEFRRSVSTSQTRLGLATGWGHTLSDAGRTALSLCQSLEVEDVQYRTDVGKIVGDRWHQVSETLVGG